jgi:signal peptidase I
MATVFFLGTFIVLLVIALLAGALFFQLGSRWVKIPNVTFLRALAVVVAAELVGWIPVLLLDRVQTTGRGQAIAIVVLQLVLSLGVNGVIAAQILRTKFWRATLAWLPTLIPNLFLCAFALFVIRPYVFEAFKITANSMAPTVLGQHWEARCPRCGSPTFCTPENEPWRRPNQPVLMICSKESRSCQVDSPPRAEYAGDRVTVNKLLQPRRWDIVVFRLPEDPAINFCQRLVGLPGETVTIRDGAVWIDGKKQTPPDSCRGIKYLDRVEGPWADLWGSETKPAKLGPDEYFVLGDFSARAKDSRLWQQGAPGHPPYAVPASHLIGVVTHIYWPPSRCRALR